MAFIRDLFKKLKVDPKSKKSYTYLNKCDPMDIWNVVSEIGDGAFGKVFKAENQSENVVAALKQVNLEEEGDLEEYIVEIEILTECKHSNVVNLYAAYLFEKKLWMALEYCNGGALDSLMITLDKNLNEKAIKYASKEILSGLIFLHSHSVIHRDMKAGNVLITETSEVKLADFGVSAKLVSEKQKRNTVQGTPYWMAPEVIACQNMESFYDCRADIWSFGITLIELAQMRPPYHQMQPTRVLLKISKADPPTLDRPRLWSTAFNNFLKRCLVKKPEDRPYGTELLSDPFITTCTEAERHALKVLIYEARADQVELTEEELDIKDVRKSLMPSQTFDDISETDNTSIESSEQLDYNTNTASSSKIDVANEVLDKIVVDQIKSENDKLSILGVVCEVMENPLINSEELVNKFVDPNMFNRRESLRMAMDIVPDILEVDKKDEDLEKESIQEEESDKDSNVQTNISRNKSCYKTMTKTRKFVVDGEEITTKTTKVVREGLENKNREQIQDRKLEIRELQLLAKEESRQKRQINFKILSEKENLINKQKAEEMNFEKVHETDMENLIRSHKVKLERLENQNFADTLSSQKRLFSEKSKKELEFKNKEKSDFNKELDKISKNQRKDAIKKLKDNQNLIFQEKFRQFQENLTKDIDQKIDALSKINRQKICELELSLMKEKHQKLTKYNKEKARLCIDHCQGMYQLDTQHKKEMFMLGRQQAKYRQDKEIEHLEKNNKKELDELDYIQQNEKKSFPKFIKNTSRTRNIQKRRELEIQLHKNIITNSEMKSRLKEFDESEKEREKNDMKRMELKLNRKRDEMLSEHFQRRHELDQLHAEYKKELIDQEKTFLRDVDKKHREEIMDLTKVSEEREIAEEESYRLQEEKLRIFYNSEENCNGTITPYSKLVDDKKYVEALC